MKARRAAPPLHWGFVICHSFVIPISSFWFRRSPLPQPTGVVHMGIIERSIRQPVAVAVVVLLLVMFGVLSAFRVPVQLTPNVDQPVVSVTTRWFGAQPQEVEQELLQEQEEVLKTIPGLREMTSEATEGQGTVRLEFGVGVDKALAIDEVEQKLNQVPEYPPDSDRPVIESVDSSARDWIRSEERRVGKE